MKVAFSFCLLAGLLVPSLGIKFTRCEDENEAGGVASPEGCKICITFAEKALNELLNLILGGVVVDGCGDLCGALAAKTNKITGEICDVLCTIVGIKEFIKIVEEADLDPIYYCELLDQCEINDHGDATITNATAIPKSAPQGQFHFPMTYVSKNGTGTGELGIFINTIDEIPVENTELNVAQKPGTHGVEWNLKAVPDPNCDPTQGPCEKWLPGLYNVTIVICEGECGSKHPHSSIYDEAHLTFEITG